MSERPFLTVDCVVFHDGSVVLIRRAYEPFKGWYALPGGFVEIGETVEDACRRETREETGLVVQDLRLIGVYSDPARDPRRHTVSVAFLGRADISSLKAGVFPFARLLHPYLLPTSTSAQSIAYCGKTS